MKRLKFYQLKNKVSIVLPENWAILANEDKGFPLLRTETHFNNYGPLPITKDSLELFNTTKQIKKKLMII